MKRHGFWQLIAVLLLLGAGWIVVKRYRCYRLERDFEERLAELKRGADAALTQGSTKATVEEFFKKQHLQYSFRRPGKFDTEPTGTELVGNGFEVIKICDSVICNGDIHVVVHASFDSRGLIAKDVRPSFACS